MSIWQFSTIGYSDSHVDEQLARDIRKLANGNKQVVGGLWSSAENFTTSEILGGVTISYNDNDNSPASQGFAIRD